MAPQSSSSESTTRPKSGSVGSTTMPQSSASAESSDSEKISSPSFSHTQRHLTATAGNRVGRISVTGRFVRLPKRLEDDFELDGRVLGTGMSGSVLSGVSRHCPDLKVAIKELDLKEMDERKRNSIRDEVEVFLSLDHPSIARLHAVYESEDRLSLVQECLAGGELLDRITEHEKFSEKCAAAVTYQMLKAVSYLHHAGVVHRDLKLENFLFDAPGCSFLKLIDFGFSKFHERKGMTESLGTLSYVAPEVLRKDYGSGSCDMWSLGVIVYVLLSGRMPFGGKSDKDKVRAIVKGKFTMGAEFAGVSKAAKDFIRQLLVVNPKKRMTACQALQHPWLSDVKCLPQLGATPYLDPQSLADGFLRFAKANRVQKAFMKAMSWKMFWSIDRKEINRVRKGFFELGPTGGVVKKSDLKAFLTRELRSCPTCPTATEIMELLDEDINGDIRYSDYLSAIVAASDLENFEETVKATFRQFDVDGLGYLRPEALQEVLGDDFDIEDIFRTLDLDSDGKISIDEFFAYLTGMHEELDVETESTAMRYSAPRCMPPLPFSRNSFTLRKTTSSEGSKRERFKQGLRSIFGLGGA